MRQVEDVAESSFKPDGFLLRGRRFGSNGRCPERAAKHGEKRSAREILVNSFDDRRCTHDPNPPTRCERASTRTASHLAVKRSHSRAHSIGSHPARKFRLEFGGQGLRSLVSRPPLLSQ